MQQTRTRRGLLPVNAEDPTVPKKAARKHEAETEAPTFEESLEALESVVRTLEEGRLGLSESLQRYEQGVRHLKQCYHALEVAERRIELLAGVDAEGNAITEPFDEDELSLDEKAASRSQRRSRRRATGDGDDQATSQAPGSLF
jgi:exodeoxyribonuclease VII small subunit